MMSYGRGEDDGGGDDPMCVADHNDVHDGGDYSVTIEDCGDEDEEWSGGGGDGGTRSYISGNVPNNRIPDPHDPTHMRQREKRMKRERMRRSGQTVYDGAQKHNMGRTFASQYSNDGVGDMYVGMEGRKKLEAMLHDSNANPGDPVHYAVYFAAFASFVEAHQVDESSNETMMTTEKDTRECIEREREKKTRRGRSHVF